MNKKEIITINDNEEYMILDTTELKKEQYLYCVKIDANEMPTTEYCYFKGIEEDGELYVEEIEDENLLASVIAIFAAKNITIDNKD